ncbi:MAG: hypothetical protein FWE69_02445 [Clostridiales bacterium]|nr:hypothetical protein [Clostridiales bacterium]
MITVGKIQSAMVNGLAVLSSEIKTETTSEMLFFAVREEQETYLCTDRADAFLVTVLIKAMREHQDILVESPISERLLYGIQTFLIPAWLKMNPAFSPIKIIATHTTTEPASQYGGLATGISCGVDSLYTVLSNLNGETPPSLKLTHLILFNECRVCAPCELTTEDNVKIKASKEVTQALGLTFVPVWSNAILFFTCAFEHVHTFHNMAHALALQPLIKTYYYASGHSIKRFWLDFSDASHYDLINAKALKTESFEMISHDPLVDRFEKTRYISSFELTQTHLDVCVRPQKSETHINCSECFKCLRTMLTLDVLGVLDRFISVFDVKTYRKNCAKNWGMTYYIRWRIKDEFAEEIIENARKFKYKIPFSACFWMLATGLFNQFAKLKRIMKRSSL